MKKKKLKSSYKRLKEVNDKLRKDHGELMDKFLLYLKDPSSEAAVKIAAEMESHRIMRMMPKYSFMSLLGVLPLVYDQGESSTYSWQILDRTREETPSHDSPEVVEWPIAGFRGLKTPSNSNKTQK